jgi:hypothetical protein
MPFGPDSCCKHFFAARAFRCLVDGSRRTLATLNDSLKFLRTFRSLYFSNSVDSYADTHGVGIITRRLQHGSLRDRLYNAKPEDTFIRKYSMNKDCFVIGKFDTIFIARQILEVIRVLKEINCPYCKF